MEMYSVTVNGVTYEVAVEKKSGQVSPQASSAVMSTPISPTVPAKQAQNVAPAEISGIKITAGAAGKIWKVLVSKDQSVKAGDPIVILEAMKMEIPVVAPKDGVITQVMASEGDPVEAGDLLATMN